MKRTYRADIDGLRAVAVLAVVVFHFFPKVLPGGFTGVDIFFVISGFLVTGIISDEIANRDFSIARFYARRARRIFPSLVLVLVVSLVAGKLLLMPLEFRPVAESSIASVFFAANFYFFFTANYFDSEALMKPLLHLWSLGVEEQFYLVWPWLLVFLPTGRPLKVALLATVVLLSFAINLYSTPHAPTAAFFLPFGRLWELGLGGLGAFCASSGRLSKRTREILSIAGCALLLYSIFRVREAGFPGLKSLLPTLGAVFVIVAGPGAFLNRYVLSARPSVEFGLISYPLYLWHWPVVSFMSISFGDVSRAEKIYGMIASTVLAYLTTRFYERPLRGWRPGLPTVPVGLTAALALIGAVCVGLRLAPIDQDSLQARLFSHYKNYVDENDLYRGNHMECSYPEKTGDEARTTALRKCTTPTPGAPNILLWGDSHAQHLRYGLDRIAGPTLGLMQVATVGCGPTVDLQTGRYGCDASNTYALDVVERTRPQIVVLAQRGDHESTDWTKVATRLKALGVQTVILVGPVPQWKPFLYRRVALDYPDFPKYSARGLDGSVLATDKILAARYSSASDLKYVSLVDLLCRDGACLTTVRDRPDANGLPVLVTFDYGHFTREASEDVVRRLILPAVGARAGVQ